MKHAAQRTLLGLVVLAAVCTAGWFAPESRASCNTIPEALPWFPSEQGAVRQPIAAPNAAVEIQLNPACPNQTQKFEPTDVVRLSIVSPLGGQVDLNPVVEERTDWTMRITVPDTITPSRPNGVAGPAMIVVTTSGNQQVAKIDQLYQPTSGCDHQPEEVFQTFTVLPKPNDVKNPNKLLATVDGGGNLLIPFDHSSVIPPAGADPLGVFEYGKGLFHNFKVGGKPINQALQDALNDGASAPELLRVYSLQGQPLPALARFGNSGAMFGIADSKQSVLRLSRLYGAGKQVFNVLRLLHGDNAEEGTQPIVLKKKLVGGDDFKLEACDQSRVDLRGLRASKGVVTYTVGGGARAGKVQIHDAQNGEQSCGKNVNQAAAVIGGQPQLTAGEGLVAFGEPTPGGSRLRVYDAEAHEANTSSAALPLVQSILGVSDPFVFFSKPGSPLGHRVFNASNATFLPRAETPVVDAAVSGGRSILRRPDGAVALYSAPSDNLAELAAAGGIPLAISPELAAFTKPLGSAAPAASGALLVVDVRTPTPAPTAQDVGVTAEQIKAAGSVAAFISAEAAEPADAPGCKPTNPVGGCDLNNDQDASDRVLRLYVQDGAGLTETRFPAKDFVIGEGYVAFRSPEKEQSVPDALCGSTGSTTTPCDRNQDNDALDDVMMVYEIATATVYNTGQAARLCDICRAVGLEWMDPYAIRDGHLFFLTNEMDQDKDLDGNGIADVNVLQVFDLKSKKIWSVGAMSTGAGQATPGPLIAPMVQTLGGAVSPVTVAGAPPAPTPSFVRLVQRASPDTDDSFVVGDGDGDGTFDPFDNCAGVANPDQADDDCDGLGDRRCDPTYCTDFAPRVRFGRGKKVRSLINVEPELLKPLATSLGNRAAATRECFDRLATAGAGSDAGAFCGGYFVNGVEVFPQEPQASQAVQGADADLLRAVQAILEGRPQKALKKKTSHRDTAATAFARRLSATYGESVNAAMRVAYGNLNFAGGDARAKYPRPLGRERLECQKALGEASAAYLAQTFEAMLLCVRTHEADARDPAAFCLGSIRGGNLVPPEDEKTRFVLESAAAKLRAAANSDVCAGRIASLDACANEPMGAARCISCVGWRRAVEATLSTYGPAKRASACDRRRRPLPPPASALRPEKHLGKDAAESARK